MVVFDLSNVCLYMQQGNNNRLWTFAEEYKPPLSLFTRKKVNRESDLESVPIKEQERQDIPALFITVV